MKESLMHIFSWHYASKIPCHIHVASFTITPSDIALLSSLCLCITLLCCLQDNFDFEVVLFMATNCEGDPMCEDWYITQDQLRITTPL